MIHKGAGSYMIEPTTRCSPQVIGTFGKVLHHSHPGTSRYLEEMLHPL